MRDVKQWHPPPAAAIGSVVVFSIPGSNASVV